MTTQPGQGATPPTATPPTTTPPTTTPPTKKLWVVVTEKVVKWWVFGIILATLPLIMDGCSGEIQVPEKGLPFDWRDVIKKGELLLVAAGIAAAGIGEILDASGKNRIMRYIAGGACVISVMGSSLLYAFVSSEARKAVNPVLTKAQMVIAKVPTPESGSKPKGDGKEEPAVPVEPSVPETYNVKLLAVYSLFFFVGATVASTAAVIVGSIAHKNEEEQ